MTANYDTERDTVSDLINRFILNKDELPYANLDSNDEYLGWVYDFQLKDTSGKKIFLDLKTENDLFLLFALALSWSRTGPWENPVFFIAYLKLQDKASPQFWQKEENFTREKAYSERASGEILKQVQGINPRRKIGFRKDTYLSVYILANHWDMILRKLEESERRQNFLIAMEYIRSIEGLGTGNKRMMKKIPLILRELRCQDVYSNIPGELCCVADTRVRSSAEVMGIYLPPLTGMENLIKSSAIIYELFGNLYDIPLFAYQDLRITY